MLLILSLLFAWYYCKGSISAGDLLNFLLANKHATAATTDINSIAAEKIKAIM